MDEIEKFAKEIHEAFAEIGLGSKREREKYFKQWLAEIKKEDEKKYLEHIKDAGLCAFITKKALELGNDSLVFTSEALVIDTISQSFTVKTWNRNGAVYEIGVLELDEPLIINPQENT
jgi:hypothetical protein